MSYLPNINKKIIVILLLMQVSIAYALPAWASINLCIGYDGHVDIEKRGIGIVGRTAEPFSQQAVVSSNDGHHGDCFDIEISGLSTQLLYFRAEQLRLRDGESTTRIDGVGALSSYIDLSQLLPRPILFPHNDTTPSSNFTFHRTVVLLI